MPTPKTHQISAGIVADAHQITHHLDLRRSNRHRGDLTQPLQPGQTRGIPGIGLDASPAGRCSFDGAATRHSIPAVVDLPRKPKARGTRLVSHPHRATKL